MTNVRARLPAASSPGNAPLKLDLGTHQRPSLKTIEREVLELQRSAGNRAVTGAVQRQAAVQRTPVVQRAPAADGGFKIISEVWQVAERDVVVVATGHGDQVLFFYRRTGMGDKGAGVAVEPGKWAPFKTFMEQDESILKGKARPGKAWFNKQPYYSQVHKDNALRGYANQRNQQVGQWLDKQEVPAGKVKHWETVEQEMDKVANDYRKAARAKAGGGGGAGAGSKAGATEAKAGATEVKGAAAEVKGLGTEAKGVGLEVKGAGVEAKALATEAKLVGAEVTGVMKAENVLTKGAQIAAKGAKIARISELVIALGMPGPQDVFFMFISAFASIAEAKAKLRADSYATGFAEGIAAKVTWTSGEDATRMLMFRVADPSMGERVAGFEGTREAGTNEGLLAGWKFADNLNGEQRKGFRHLALEATGIKEKRHSNRDELIALGGAIRPTVVELLAEAARQEQEKEDKEKAEAYQRMAAARRR